jgi:ATP:corrinoid adenosyltransferase
MKGSADAINSSHGEYNAIGAVPGFSYENTTDYEWCELIHDSDGDEQQAKAYEALRRTRKLLRGASDADLDQPIELNGDPAQGFHMLILGEVLYAVEQEQLDPSIAEELIETKPPNLELVLTGSHTKPTYIGSVADVVTEVNTNEHLFHEGVQARSGTEY